MSACLLLVAWIEVIDTLKDIRGLEQLQAYGLSLRSDPLLIGSQVFFFRKQEHKRQDKDEIHDQCGGWQSSCTGLGHH